MPRNPRWTRDELILALDVYLRYGTGSKSSEYVVELNSLRDRNDFPDPNRFRNPNGVSMKLSNFARLDPNYQGVGLSAGSYLEVEVWNDLSGDKQALAGEVVRIKGSSTAGCDDDNLPEATLNQMPVSAAAEMVGSGTAIQSSEVDSETAGFELPAETDAGFVRRLKSLLSRLWSLLGQVFHS